MVFHRIEIVGWIESRKALVDGLDPTENSEDIVSVSELLEAIFERLRETHISRNAVPEHLPVLRGFQFVASHRKEVCRALEHKVTKDQSLNFCRLEAKQSCRFLNAIT